MAARWWSQLSWVLSFRSIFDLGPEGRGSSRSPLHDLLHKISQTRSPRQLSGSRFTRKSKTCRYREIVPPQPITYQCHINRAWPSPFSPPPSVISASPPALQLHLTALPPGLLLQQQYLIIAERQNGHRYIYVCLWLVCDEPYYSVQIRQKEFGSHTYLNKFHH